jgi:putative transposase
MVRCRSIRLAEFDYASAGAYFITICTFRRELLFEQRQHLEVARLQWDRSAVQRADVELDAFVVMPNHVHGVIWLRPGNAAEAQHAAPLHPDQRVASRSLGAFVRAYKSAVTREINLIRNTPAAPLWQRNYYEHVVRSEHDLTHIRQYIKDNPRRWHLDRENPSALPDDQEIAFWRNLSPAVAAQRAAPVPQE